MATFQINHSDPAHVMFDKLNSYVATLKKEKYNNLLKLLNDLFETKHNTLRHFTQMECSYFDKKSMSKLIKILELHKSKFNYDTSKIKNYYNTKKNNKNNENDTNHLKDSKSNNEMKDVTNNLDKNISVKSNSKNGTKNNSKKEVEEEFNVSKEIFFIISKLLKTIEYKLIKINKNNIQYYSVIMC